MTTVDAPRSLFRSANFALLFGGELTSQLGTRVNMVALPLVAILVLRASPLEAGILAAAQTSAFVLIGLPAGVWVDRMRRRRLMITTDLVRAALLASIPIAWSIGALGLSQLYVVAIGVSLATVLFEVAYQSFLPVVVGPGRLVDGNSKIEIVRSGAQIAGPNVGGWLVHAVSAPVAVIANAISFAGSALLLSRIDVVEPAPARAARPAFSHEIRDGVRFVLSHPILRMIAARSALANLAFAMVLAVQALFLVEDVGLSPVVYGTVLAAGALGGLVGSVLSGTLVRWVGSARILWLAPLIGPPFALLIPFTEPGPRIAFFIVGSFVDAIGVVLYNIAQISFRQAITPERLLGRVNATMRFLVWGAMPIGALVGGGLGERYGVRAALWIGLTVTLVSAIPLLASPLVRMRDLPASPQRISP